MIMCDCGIRNGTEARMLLLSTALYQEQKWTKINTENLKIHGWQKVFQHYFPGCCQAARKSKLGKLNSPPIVDFKQYVLQKRYPDEQNRSFPLQSERSNVRGCTEFEIVFLFNLGKQDWNNNKRRRKVQQKSEEQNLELRETQVVWVVWCSGDGGRDNITNTPYPYPQQSANPEPSFTSQVSRDQMTAEKRI